MPLPYTGRICFALMYPQGGFGPKSKRLKSITMMPNFLFVMFSPPIPLETPSNASPSHFRQSLAYLIPELTVCVTAKKVRCRRDSLQHFSIFITPRCLSRKQQRLRSFSWLFACWMPEGVSHFYTPALYIVYKTTNPIEKVKMWRITSARSFIFSSEISFKNISHIKIFQ